MRKHREETRAIVIYWAVFIVKVLLCAIILQRLLRNLPSLGNRG